MFIINDEVKNAGTAPVTLSPYALVSRHGIPPGFLGLYVSHEGLIGMFGDKGLLTETYSGIERRKTISYSATNAWLGITDRYWATALLPNSDVHLDATFEEIDGTSNIYQAKYLLDAQIIPPRGSGSADTRLFAGAKEVAILDRYTETLHLNKLNSLIDWGGLYFIYKPTFLIIDFLFRFVHNYGVAILLFAVLVQLIFFPLANKTYAAVAKTRAARPLDMSDHVNPLLRGLYVTILILVQFSLFKVLFVTVEMRHAPFLGWIGDLSMPDPTNIFDLFGLMPFDPATVPMLGSFLVLGIWPAIMCVTIWMLIKLNRAPVDPTQKVIFNWMPIVVGYSLASAAAGLVIYRACHSSLSLLHQSLMIQRFGGKVQLSDDLKRTFAKPTLTRSLADYLYILRGGRASMNVPISIRILRSVRKASRITFWLMANQRQHYPRGDGRLISRYLSYRAAVRSGASSSRVCSGTS